MEDVCNYYYNSYDYFMHARLTLLMRRTVTQKKKRYKLCKIKRV